MFDKLGPRLQDSNSKVNVYALQKLLQLIPHLAGYLGSVINMSIQNIVPNLSSKNKEIHSSAMEVLESFIEHLGKRSKPIHTIFFDDILTINSLCNGGFNYVCL